MFKPLSFGLSPEEEDRFRQTSLERDLQAARLVIGLSVPVSVGFAINDYLFYGLSWRFYGLLVVRLSLAFAALAFVSWSRTAKSYRSYDKAAFAWGLFIAVVLLLVAAGRPPGFFGHAVPAAVLIVAVMVAVPTRFSYQICVALLVLVGDVLISATGFRATPQAAVSAIVGMFLALAVALPSARSLHSTRRREFLALERERSSLAAARQELTERQRAEEALVRSRDELEQRVQERTAELVQRAAELRAMAAEFALVEQRERGRLARVLHDHLSQLLVAAKSRTALLGAADDARAAQAVREIETLLDESIAASRSLTAELSPPILHEAGLAAGLQWLARRMAERHDLRVDLQIDDPGPLPEDVTILVYDSIRELLFNVVKHAQTGSAALELRRVDGMVQATISDSGVGFDPESKTGEHGFGLLGIRERLHLAGGTLTIDSSPGQGSRFVIALPIVEPVAVVPDARIAVPPRAQAGVQAVAVAGRRIRVLIVDDHAMVREGIAGLLEHESDIDIVGEAANGLQAIEEAERGAPDVILMDISMPELNGIDATRIIHGRCPDIRIIGLSMFEEADTAQAMREAGAIHYVTKSSLGRALVGAIRRVCEISGEPPQCNV